MMNNSVPTSLEEWRQYWQAKGFPWRTEPEINVKRREELSKCRAIVPDIEKGIYPFKGMKLSRADMEWLLATHENGRGPVIWADEQQRSRAGLNLCGADLRGSKECPLSLKGLPLSNLCGGYSGDEELVETWELQSFAGILLKETNLSKAHLEGANLSGAYLEETNLSKAHLEGANLRKAHLEGADLNGAGLERTDLRGAFLERADLPWADLRRAFLSEAHLADANLGEANLEGCRLSEVDLAGARLYIANLMGADLGKADLRRANLAHANLSKAHLEEANLEGADLERADLTQANLSGAHLEEANLTRADLGGADLSGTILAEKDHIGPLVADIRWGETNLNVVDWSQITILGEERQAQQKQNESLTVIGRVTSRKSPGQRLDEHRRAVWANRQLAIVLQDQGLNEDAARFAYRAQVLQRKVFWMQKAIGKWFFSLLLALLAGYGYRIWRILVAYLIIVLLCAVAYFVLGMYYEPHLSFLEAVLTSITAFHGGVFSEPFLQPGDPQLWVTAFEAVAGLVIEGVFIAMLTQKFFGK